MGRLQAVISSGQRRVQLARRVGRRLGWWLGQPGGMVLLYHRVTTLGVDPWAQCVTPERFAEQLEVLARHFVVLPLDAFARAAADGGLPRRAVALAFDDGYADNLENAAPLLERQGLPATLFLITERPGGVEFWSDQLDQLVWGWEPQPPSFELIIRGERRVFRPGAGRQALYMELWDALRMLAGAERAEVMNRLSALSGVTIEARATHRMMSDAEVAELAQGGVFQIGAHTVSHPWLPALPPAAQHDEITRSRQACAELTGRLPEGFAYPYGAASEVTADLVREAGFRYAGAVLCDVVQARSDPFMLARMPVRNWDGEDFARRLSSGFLRR